jgi:hypothetical protein
MAGGESDWLGKERGGVSGVGWGQRCRRRRKSVLGDADCQAHLIHCGPASLSLGYVLKQTYEKR